MPSFLPVGLAKMTPKCGQMSVTHSLFSVSTSIRKKMPNPLRTRILPLPILLYECLLCRPRKTGQLRKSAGGSPEHSLLYIRLGDQRLVKRTPMIPMTRRAKPSACRTRGILKSIIGGTGGACFGGWLLGEVFFGSILTAGVLPGAGVPAGELPALVDALLGVCVAALIVAFSFGCMALLLGETGAVAEPADVVIVPPPCISMGKTPDIRKIKTITAAIVLIMLCERCIISGNQRRSG